MYFDEQLKVSCRFFSNRLEEKNSPFIFLYCLTCVLARRHKGRCWMEEKTSRDRRSERSFPSFGGKSFATYAERPGETAWREVTSAAGTRQVSVSTPPPPPRPPLHPRRLPGRREASCCATRVFPTNWYPQLLTSPRCLRNHRRQNYPLYPEPVAYARYSPQKQL